MWLKPYNAETKQARLSITCQIWRKKNFITSAGFSNLCDRACKFLNQECLTCVCNPLLNEDVIYKPKPEWGEYGPDQSQAGRDKGDSGLQEATAEPVACVIS